MIVVFLYIQNYFICDGRISDRKRGYFMEFFTQAIATLKVLVMALGAGLGVWGIINLLEGYGNDNPGAKSQGMKQVECLLRWQNYFDKAVFKTAYLCYVISVPIFPIKR